MIDQDRLAQVQTVTFPTEPTVANCGHTVVAHGIGTGIAYDGFDYTRCYDCAHAEQVEDMRTARHFFAYLSRDCQTVTDWPGMSIGRVLKAWDGGERWSAYGRVSRVYVHVRDVHGCIWYGSGPRENGSYVRLHRAGKKLSAQYR